MCGIVGYVGEQQSAPHPRLRAAEARVPRLRLGGPGGGERRELGVVAPAEAGRTSRRRSVGAAERHARHRAHPLGDARRAHRRERPPPRHRRRVAVVHNGIIENHLRAEGDAPCRGAQSRLRDRHRGVRPPHRRRAARGQELPRRCGRRSAQVEGTLRAGGGLAADRTDWWPPGQLADGGRPRRGPELRGQRQCRRCCEHTTGTWSSSRRATWRC